MLEESTGRHQGRIYVFNRYFKLFVDGGMRFIEQAASEAERDMA